MRDQQDPVGQSHAPSSRSGTSAHWVLRPVRAIAALALLAMLLGRAVAPSLPGVTVGIDTVVEVTGFVASSLAQLFAIVATMLAMAQIVTVARSREISLPVRIPSVVLGGLVILVALSAAGTQLPDFYYSIIGFSAATLAIIAGADGVRMRQARIPALAVGLAGLASMIRLAAVGLAMYSVDRGLPDIGQWARVAATGTFALDALLVVVACGWAATRSRRMASPLVLMCFALAMFATRAALSSPDEATPLFVLAARAGSRLVPRPGSLAPYQVEVFVAVLGVLIAMAVLVARGQIPALAGALSLALVVRSSAEVPLLGVALVVASLSAVLGARDMHGMWATLLATRREPPVSTPADSPPEGSARDPG